MVVSELGSTIRPRLSQECDRSQLRERGQQFLEYFRQPGYEPSQLAWRGLRGGLGKALVTQFWGNGVSTCTTSQRTEKQHTNSFPLGIHSVNGAFYRKQTKDSRTWSTTDISIENPKNAPLCCIDAPAGPPFNN